MHDDQIYPKEWHDSGGSIHVGGTLIGTARCKQFMTREGRRKSAKNLLNRGIDRLIVIGGDGSLTGAQLLYDEWPSLLREILEEEKSNPNTKLDESILTKHSHLTIIGMVGSIDNDLVGADFTIGCDTALNQIVRAVDALTSTAMSHQREFVVEVMGRNCGWLALYGAIATGADWVLIPENPIPGDWKIKMCSTIKKGKEMGRRSSIVLLAEGARDVNGHPVTSAEVKDALDSAGFDTRITILGHVQRGGSPTAFDRNQSTILGACAAELVMSENKLEPTVLVTRGNRPKQIPLRECLENNAKIVKLIKEQNYDNVMQLRTNNYLGCYNILRTLVEVNIPEVLPGAPKVAIVHVGACSPGMNASVRVLTRLSLSRGFNVYGVKGGLDGLLTGDIMPLNWMAVNGWAGKGGAILGTKRNTVTDYVAVSKALEKFGISALVIVGGWDGYDVGLSLFKLKESESYLKKVSIVMVPASISNNVPCTEFSVGCDTSLNNVVECCDKIKQSAVSSAKLFFVEVMGTSGFLAVMSALATGADQIYLAEKQITLETLQKDIDRMTKEFKEHPQSSSLVINNEHSSKVFKTKTLSKLYRDQSGGVFEVRTAALGHLQQGGTPTGLDRIFGNGNICRSSRIH
eukprot:TRINITY_DN2540_c0_g1_i2.p1 TRINITY_DN2540_c0_g1~~TRINITY_DN2540_c0_g1_i2.p1  ORF type:complete len:693 (-),score=191.55 TRINITY_DN2540_c0_g1_i2:198-2093(-)